VLLWVAAFIAALAGLVLSLVRWQACKGWLPAVCCVANSLVFCMFFAVGQGSCAGMGVRAVGQ
jgi:hypothetical protein